MSEKVAGDGTPGKMLSKALQFNVSSEVQDAIKMSSANLDKSVTSNNQFDDISTFTTLINFGIM